MCEPGIVWGCVQSVCKMFEPSIVWGCVQSVCKMCKVCEPSIVWGCKMCKMCKMSVPQLSADLVYAVFLFLVVCSCTLCCVCMCACVWMSLITLRECVCTRRPVNPTVLLGLLGLARTVYIHRI